MSLTSADKVKILGFGALFLILATVNKGPLWFNVGGAMLYMELIELGIMVRKP